jgi:hypothetical protein
MSIRANRFKLEVRQRPPTPRRLRLSQHPRGPLEPLLLESAMTCGQQLLEHRKIELPGLDTQYVAWGTRQQPGVTAARAVQHPTQARDLHAQHALGLIGVAERLFDQPAARSDTALSNSIASRARRIGPPIGTATPSTRTSSGPST